ncbi:MAG: 3-hydroxyacyl-CoA dehydrogenase, partial [Candidatus Competibacteraceae bacterium]|nr:3-hydroxyacyl-CoA dehydrogenase [Candidatus Competibacteraceae bacterium]
MVLNPERDDLCLGIIGAGTMGRGIAQIAATAGITVLLYDSNPRSSAAAFEFIRAMLERAVAKGRMSTSDVASALARIHCINELAGMKSCHIVIEAILEDIAAKHALFSTLEPIVSPETILATNTSSLSVTAIAAACKHPERVAGMHFFNPVPLMKLVEIIEGIRTSPDVSATLAALGRRLGREPVQLQDTPGFLVNQVGRGFTVEATHIVAEGVADFATIDRIMRDAGGFRMG